LRSSTRAAALTERGLEPFRDTALARAGNRGVPTLARVRTFFLAPPFRSLQQSGGSGALPRRGVAVVQSPRALCRFRGREVHARFLRPSGLRFRPPPSFVAPHLSNSLWRSTRLGRIRLGNVGVPVCLLDESWPTTHPLILRMRDEIPPWESLRSILP